MVLSSLVGKLLDTPAKVRDLLCITFCVVILYILILILHLEYTIYFGVHIQTNCIGIICHGMYIRGDYLPPCLLCR